MTFWRRVFGSFAIGMLLSVAGCGSASVSDMMMERAKAKASMRDPDEEEEEEEVAQNTPPPPSAIEPAPASPPTPGVEAPPTPDAIALSPTGKMTVTNRNAPPSIEIDSTGRILAFDKGDGTVGVYDVQKRELLRNVGSENFKPRMFALDRSGRQLFASDASGQVQILSIDETNGLDVFERQRRRTQGGGAGLLVSHRPVTAIAPVGFEERFLVADEAGDVRMWSSAHADDVSLDSGGERVVALERFGGGKFLFALAEKSGTGQVVFWPVKDGLPMSDGRRSYVELAGRPTRMIQSTSAGGLAVGDSTGAVHVWAPSKIRSGKVEQSVLKVADAPITGLAFLPDLSGIVASDSRGNLRRYDLPIAQRRSIDLSSADAEFLERGHDAGTVIVRSRGTGEVVSLQDGKVLTRFSAGNGSSLNSVVSVTGGIASMFAAGTSNGFIDFLDATTGQLVGRVLVDGPIMRLWSHTSSQSVLYSTESGEFGKLQVPTVSASLPAATGNLLMAVDSQEEQAIVVSLDNRLTRLYSMSDGRIISSTSLAGSSTSLAGIDATVTSVALRGGVALAGTSSGGFWIWQTDQPRARPSQLATTPDQLEIREIVIGDAGIVRWIDSSGGVGTVKIDDLSAGSINAAIRPKTPLGKYSLGEKLALGSVGSKLFVLRDGAPEFEALDSPEANPLAIVVSPISLDYAILGESGNLWVGAAGGELQKLPLLSGFVPTAISITTDGKQLLASNAQSIVTIDLSTKKVVSQHLESSGVARIIGGPRGRCLFVDQQGAARRRTLVTPSWTIEDPVRVNTFEHGSDQQTVLAGTETGQVWSIQLSNGSTTSTHQISENGIQSLVRVGDGLLLAVEDISGRVFDCSKLDQPTLWKSGALPPVAQIATSSAASGRALLQTTDGGVLVVSVNDSTGAPAPLSLESLVEHVELLDESTALVKYRGKGALLVVPLDENGRSIATDLARIESMVSVPGQRALAICDGSSIVSVLDLDSSERRTFDCGNGIACNRVAIDLSGGFLVGICSSDPSRSGGDVFVWNLRNPEEVPRRIAIPSAISVVQMSVDGSRLYVGLADKTLRCYDRLDGVELERQVLDAVATSIDTNDMNALWVGTDQGSVVRVPQRMLSRIAAFGEPVRLVDSIRGEMVVCASDSKLSLTGLDQGTNSNSEKKPLREVVLADGGLQPIALTIRGDGKAIALSQGGNAPKVDVWKLAESIPWGEKLEPSVSILLQTEADAIQFISETQLIVGQRDGLIQIFDLTNQKPAFQFNGHQTPVASMVLVDNGTQLLSCSADRSVRRWSIPTGAVRGSDTDIPQSQSVADTDLNTATEATTSVEVSKEEDSFAEVRAALLTGSGVASEADVFELFEDDSQSTGDVATKFRKLKELEQAAESAMGDKSAAVLKLAVARKEFHEERRSLASLQRVSGGTTFADNQPNLLFNTATDFDFSTGIRSVETQINDNRFVYAAMRPGPQHPGKLAVWDFGVSGVKTHAWNDLQLRINELLGLPDGRGVLTLPDMRVFAQDGTSRSIAEAFKYTISSGDGPYGGERLFAVANRGSVGKEATMIQVYRHEDLMRQSATPVASMSGFESEVTAIAFAHSHRSVAFSIRERSGYRLVVGDPKSLEPRSITLLADGRIDRPWLVTVDAEGKSSNEPGAPGPTTICFSPDDRFLVVHSRIAEAKFTYSVYKLDWSADGTLSPASVSRFVGPVEREGAFFDESTTRPLFFVTRKLTPEEQKESGLSFTNSNVVAFQNGDTMQVVNSVSGAPMRKMPLLKSAGYPRYSVTQDGQWYVTGDDRGRVVIGNLGNGKSYELTPDGRPAHAGPIVGVAISDTDEVLQLPEYVVTVGEENRLKVWDLLSRLK